jgi:hypothetical protein
LRQKGGGMNDKQTPEQRLEAAIDTALLDFNNFLVWESQQDWQDDYDRKANRKNSQDRAKAAILAAVTAELRALVPEKRRLFEPATKREVLPGGKAMIDLSADKKGSLMFIQDNGFNQAIDKIISNAKERGLL